jgi:hypothetical protein
MFLVRSVSLMVIVIMDHRVLRPNRSKSFLLPYSPILGRKLLDYDNNTTLITNNEV